MIPTPPRPTLADRCYAVLLRAYPVSYRRRFAADMRDTFSRDVSRVRRIGWFALIPFWIVTVAQAVWFGSAARRSSGVPVPNPSSPSPIRFSPLTDVRYAFRLLGRSPIFAVTSVLSLSIGLAAATVIFGLADALLFKPSPGVTDSSTLVEIGRSTNGSGSDNMSYQVFRHLREHTTTLTGMSGTTFDPSPVSLAADGSSERVFAQVVSSSYFPIMGVQPALGRFFSADDDATPDARPVVVLTHRLWRERFHSDPAVVSRSVRINNTTFVVVGVAAPEFEGTTLLGTDLWVPLSMAGPIRGFDSSVMLGSARAVWLSAIGRLKPGVSAAEAQAELNTLLAGFRTISRDVPDSHGIAVATAGRIPAMVRLPFQAFVGLLFVLTAGLLAIACSNVAGMLMARATARRREIATRLAVGATRGHLLAQLTTESMVLFGLAALVAVPLAMWLMALLRAFIPALPFPLQVDLALDLRSLGFVGGVALVTGLIFGLVPARQALRADLSSALHGQAATAARDRQRLRHGLVIAQVALSLTMVITAALFVRSLLAAASVDPGFATERVDVVSVDTTLARAGGQAGVALIDRVAERVRVVGGVEAVAHSRMIPLQGGGLSLGWVNIPGADEELLRMLTDSDWDVVSPDYFSVLNIPIVSGRAFSRDDRDGRPLVAVVNEAFAEAAWPGRSAVGQRFWQADDQGDEGRPIEVVGVARDAKYRTLGEPRRTFIYVPHAQQPESAVTFYVKHQAGRRALADVRQAVITEEPGLPVIMAQSLEEAAGIALVPQKVAAWVAGSVGVLGLCLAALGLYGLTSFLVAQRTREIAIRMALGATAGQVRSMVLHRAGWLALTGTVLGLAGAAGVGLLVQQMQLLIETQGTDPVTFIVLPAALVVVLFVASDLPARRAARTNPALTLKAE
ncbi:MAG: ABC transporter permease [Acidobacteria bacterium]|nr:ABC transporter permease [Acidobacteriota bacterium]